MHKHTHTHISYKDTHTQAHTHTQTHTFSYKDTHTHRQQVATSCRPKRNSENGEKWPRSERSDKRSERSDKRSERSDKRSSHLDLRQQVVADVDGEGETAELCHGQEDVLTQLLPLLFVPAASTHTDTPVFTVSLSLRRRSVAAYMVGVIENGRTRNPLTLWSVPAFVHVPYGCVCTYRVTECSAEERYNNCLPFSGFSRFCCLACEKGTVWCVTCPLCQCQYAPYPLNTECSFLQSGVTENGRARNPLTLCSVPRVHSGF